jgi:hypothetical protein
VGVRAGQNRPTIEANSRFRPSGVRPVMTNRFRWQVRASRSKECGHDSIVTGRNQDAGITSCKPCMTTHWKSFVYIVRIVHGRRYFESVRFIAGRLYEVSVKSESALRQCIGVPINMGTVYSVIVPSLGLSLVEILSPLSLSPVGQIFDSRSCLIKIVLSGNESPMAMLSGDCSSVIRLDMPSVQVLD